MIPTLRPRRPARATLASVLAQDPGPDDDADRGGRRRLDPRRPRGRRRTRSGGAGSRFHRHAATSARRHLHHLRRARAPAAGSTSCTPTTWCSPASTPRTARASSATRASMASRRRSPSTSTTRPRRVAAAAARRRVPAPPTRGHRRAPPGAHGRGGRAHAGAVRAGRRVPARTRARQRLGHVDPPRPLRARWRACPARTPDTGSTARPTRCGCSARCGT